MSASPTSQNELDALDALLEAQHMSPEEVGAVVDQLGEPESPEAVQYHLRLLLAANRPQDAVELGRNREPHQLWCEYAIRASALIGDSDGVRSLLEWARANADLGLFHRAVVAAAAGLLEHRFSESQPDPLNADDLEAVRAVQEILAGVLLHIEASKQVRTPIEMRATIYALRIAVLLKDRLRIERLTELLLTYSPVPPELASLVLSGIIACPENLSERLLKERPESISAQVASALLLAECHDDYATAFERAKALTPMAVEPDERRELASALLQIGQHLDEAGFAEAGALAATLLPAEDPTARLIEAAIAVHREDTDRAEELLNEHRDEDSAYWHQLMGQLRLMQGRTDDAISALREATSRLPHPGLLETVSSLAIGANRIDVATDLLKQLVEADPANVEARRRLAEVHLSQREYAQAIEQYNSLLHSGDHVQADLMNLAYALTMANRPTEAIPVYDTVCATPDPPLTALVARSQLHHAQGDPKTGFDLIAEVRDQHWGDYRFVGAYMQLAYAAGADAEASTALAQLKALQDEGKTDTEVLRAGSLEDLLEHARQRQTQTRLVSEHLVSGQLPWVIADGLLRRDPCWAWTIRTQPCSWIREDPVDRAQYSIYSTNGMSVQNSEDGSRSLAQILAVPGPAVIDITALMTLSRLELLNDALDLLGHAYIPTIHLERAVEEATRLVDHQASRRDAAIALRRAIDTGRLKLVDENINLPRLDEYSDERGVFRLADLLTILDSAQSISGEQRTALQSLGTKPAGSLGGLPSLRRGQRVRIDLVTLETLARHGLLDPTLDALVS